MSNEQNPAGAELAQIPPEEWAGWCENATSEHSGREVLVRQADRALGEVRLAEGMRLVAFEFDRFGKTTALTIKCGSEAVPVSYVVAEPQSLGEHRDGDGVMDEVRILDATGRRTSVSLA